MKSLNNVLKLVITALVLSIGLNMFLGYKTYLNSQVEEGVKEKVTIEVIVDVPSQEKTYYSYALVGSSVEFLDQAMDEIGMNYEEAGGFVTSINEITPIWDETHKEYWSILINGNYGMDGINTQVIKNGDVITFEFVDQNENS